MNIKKILKNKKGFTLTELMITVSLIGIIFSAIYSMFYINTKVFIKEESNQVLRQGMRNTLNYFLEDIQSASIVNITQTSDSDILSLQDANGNKNIYELNLANQTLSVNGTKIVNAKRLNESEPAFIKNANTKIIQVSFIYWDKERELPFEIKIYPRVN